VVDIVFEAAAEELFTAVSMISRFNQCDRRFTVSRLKALADSVIYFDQAEITKPINIHPVF
jgi:hypothetical protein